MKKQDLITTFYNICKEIVDNAVKNTDWDTDTIIRKQCEAIVDYIQSENYKNTKSGFTVVKKDKKDTESKSKYSY